MVQQDIADNFLRGACAVFALGGRRRFGGNLTQNVRCDNQVNQLAGKLSIHLTKTTFGHTNSSLNSQSPGKPEAGRYFA
jgi:hypothetical protein